MRDRWTLEKEKFLTLMKIAENFTGRRVLSLYVHVQSLYEPVQPNSFRRKEEISKKIKAVKERLETSEGRVVALSRVARHHIRYFTNSAVIGSRT